MIKVGSLVRVINISLLNNQIGIVLEIISSDKANNYCILIGERRYYVFDIEIEEVPT